LRLSAERFPSLKGQKAPSAVMPQAEHNNPSDFQFSKEKFTMMQFDRLKRVAATGAAALFLGLPLSVRAEQRNVVSFRQDKYNESFFYQHNYDYRLGAAMHFFHSKQHDLNFLTPLNDHAMQDALLNRESMTILENPPRTEPNMEYYAPYSERAIWQVLRAIDWTHEHHEQTYDIVSASSIPWDKKAEYTNKAVDWYLNKELAGIPRSPAPLDVTMRRAGVMMKPYFTLFRNYYPKSSTLFFVAHWWHPASYESMMIAGEDDHRQGVALKQMDDTMWTKVMPEAGRPQRMILSREVMPRYSRMSPESANIFDNLHMLHGIVYDCLAYPGWTPKQKQAELYRVIRAMSYQPGDEKLARKFSEPHPNMDPRVYAGWMRGDEGEMSRIMMEMMQEMMPMMMPSITPEQKERVMAQFKMKMKPGMQPGELPGSLMDALMKVMPGMKMTPDMTAPGVTPTMMTGMMVQDWQAKYGAMPGIAPLPMQDGGPQSVPPLPAAAQVTDAQVAQAKKAEMAEAQASETAAQKTASR